MSVPTSSLDKRTEYLTLNRSSDADSMVAFPGWNPVVVKDCTKKKLAFVRGTPDLEDNVKT